MTVLSLLRPGIAVAVLWSWSAAAENSFVLTYGGTVDETFISESSAESTATVTPQGGAVPQLTIEQGVGSRRAFTTKSVDEVEGILFQMYLARSAAYQVVNGQVRVAFDTGDPESRAALEAQPNGKAFLDLMQANYSIRMALTGEIEEVRADVADEAQRRAIEAALETELRQAQFVFPTTPLSAGSSWTTEARRMAIGGLGQLERKYTVTVRSVELDEGQPLAHLDLRSVDDNFVLDAEAGSGARKILFEETGTATFSARLGRFLEEETHSHLVMTFSKNGQEMTMDVKGQIVSKTRARRWPPS